MLHVSCPHTLAHLAPRDPTPLCSVVCTCAAGRWSTIFGHLSTDVAKGYPTWPHVFRHPVQLHPAAQHQGTNHHQNVKLVLFSPTHRMYWWSLHLDQVQRSSLSSRPGSTCHRQSFLPSSLPRSALVQCKRVSASNDDIPPMQQPLICVDEQCTEHGELLLHHHGGVSHVFRSVCVCRLPKPGRTAPSQYVDSIAYDIVFNNTTFASCSVCPSELADRLLEAAPRAAIPIAILRNWSFAVFYVFAEMWGSVVTGLLFWGSANAVCTVDEAQTFYPVRPFWGTALRLCGL